MELTKMDRYEIRGELGRGGMATVYRAYDPRFEREVAIKVLPAALTQGDESFRARFEREARIIASLEHSAIVTVHDYGEANGQLYLVMRLMSGGSLVDRIQKGPMSLSEAARILARLAPALDAAHARGIIHRDLKPANILFDQHEEAYLSDFGVVKLTQAAATLTGKGAIVGTPAYMSPEQGRGDPHIDARADIYSLGAILFEMLTGRVPYEAETPTGQIVKHITEPVPDILEARSDLPGACQVVIERSMAKDRAGRFATAGEMAQALERASRGEPLDGELSAGTARTPSDEEGGRLSPATGRQRLLTWLGIGGGAALLILLAFMFRPVLFPGAPSPTLTHAPPSLTWTASLSATLLQATATTSPTATATSQPTLTQRFTPNPQPPAVVVVTFLNVRSGPGIVYPVIATYPQGTAFEILGCNAEATWLAVRLPDGPLQGWVAASMVDFSGDIQALPVLPAGPTPTPRLYPPPTPTEQPPGRPTGTPTPTLTGTSEPTPYP